MSDYDPNNPLDERQLLDPNTRVDLTDVGLPGFQIGEAVAWNGTREFWLVSLDGLQRDDTDHGDALQQHDGLGPLSPEWRDRIAAAPFRCGRPRRDGQACRAIVGHLGDACGWHRLQQEADR